MQLRRIVRPEDRFSDTESLHSYSYDASGLSGVPSLVLRPQDEEQLRRIIVEANQQRLALVPRGAGTGIRGGCVKEGAVILDMRGFSKIEQLDTQRGYVEVGAGVPVGRLNEALAKHGYTFPLVPDNPGATIGGLLATNQLTEESLLFGDYHDVVESLECFDGKGRFQTLKGDDVSKVVGWEGTTGIVTKARIKVVEKDWRITLEILPVTTTNLGETATSIKERAGLVSVEYCDAACSQLLGLGEGAHILVVYANDKGSYKDQERNKKILTLRKRLPHLLWREGYTVIEEASLDESCIEAFIALCEKRGVPCYGHLVAGILIAQLRDASERVAFYADVVALGGVPGGKYGYGRLKNAFVPETVRKRLIRLKEERDYDIILNPGVIS